MTRTTIVVRVCCFGADLVSSVRIGTSVFGVCFGCFPVQIFASLFALLRVFNADFRGGATGENRSESGEQSEDSQNFHSYSKPQSGYFFVGMAGTAVPIVRAPLVGPQSQADGLATNSAPVGVSARNRATGMAFALPSDFAITI